MDQLTLFCPDDTSQLELKLVKVPKLGVVLETPGGGWRARDTGPRWGWTFYRRNGDEWESAEPTLPRGVEFLYERQQAVAVLEGFVRQYGDLPVRVRLVRSA